MLEQGCLLLLQPFAYIYTELPPVGPLSQFIFHTSILIGLCLSQIFLTLL